MSGSPVYNVTGTFFIGYSPESTNPVDVVHIPTQSYKIVSGIGKQSKTQEPDSYVSLFPFGKLLQF